jgi:hypothetical protein
MKLDKYIHIGDFDKTIDVNSPIYGEYKMTKVVTIDLIKACENMKLGPVHDFYYKFRNEVVTCKSISLETGLAIKIYLISNLCSYIGR